MPKKTLILIIVLAVVTIILIILALSSQNLQSTPNQDVGRVMPTTSPVEKTAKVIFSPQTIDLSTGSSASVSAVDILVDSGGADISGVQVELQYDPKALTNVRIDPTVDSTNFFGTTANVLFNEVKADTGRVSYAIAIGQGQASRQGVGKIATIRFQRAIGAPQSTTITFLDKTLVTVLGKNDSALKETIPLTITLFSPNQPTQAPFIPQATTIPPTVTQ